MDVASLIVGIVGTVAALVQVVLMFLERRKKSKGTDPDGGPNSPTPTPPAGAPIAARDRVITKADGKIVLLRVIDGGKGIRDVLLLIRSLIAYSRGYARAANLAARDRVAVLARAGKGLIAVTAVGRSTAGRVDGRSVSPLATTAAAAATALARMLRFVPSNGPSTSPRGHFA